MKKLSAGWCVAAAVFAGLDLLAIAALWLGKYGRSDGLPGPPATYDRCAVVRLDDEWVTRPSIPLVWTAHPRLAAAYRLTDSDLFAYRGEWDVIPFLDASGERFDAPRRYGDEVRRLPAATVLPRGRLARWADGEIRREGPDLVWRERGRERARFPLAACLVHPATSPEERADEVRRRAAEAATLRLTSSRTGHVPPPVKPAAKGATGPRPTAR